jgi:type IV pilus assembly protein PilA
MRDRKGFTLIELLIVVVIIGILAAIAIPKFSATREKAYFAAMKSDLKNLATQQEIYYSDYYGYTSSIGDLGFATSDGVYVTITDPSTLGWAAITTHAALETTQGCAIFYGEGAAPTGYGQDAGVTVGGEMTCQLAPA